MSALTLVVAGGPTTLQDLGRPGYGRFGVPEAGAMDPLALRVANRLVGNDEDEACVEFALVGGTYEASGEGCRVAVAGSDIAVSVGAVSRSVLQAIDLAAGERIAIGPARDGVYGYLAAAGGFDRPQVLGSRSTHVRSGIGGGPITPGTALPLRRGGPPADPPLALDPACWPLSQGPIRILWGPQDDAFTPEGKAALLSGDYRVTPQADRMGMRLEGPPIAHAHGFNIVSDGIALGSIQVPGTGQPIVLLADRQPTGGYPKIATVLSPDMRRLAQHGPGMSIRFAAVSVKEAEALAHADRARILELFARIAPSGPADPFGSERLLGLNLVDGFINGLTSSP